MSDHLGFSIVLGCRQQVLQVARGCLLDTQLSVKSGGEVDCSLELSLQGLQSIPMEPLRARSVSFDIEHQVSMSCTNSQGIHDGDISFLFKLSTLDA